MEKIIGISEDKRKVLLNNIDNISKEIENILSTLVEIENESNIFSKEPISVISKIEQGKNGLVNAKHIIAKLKSEEQAKERINDLKDWFNSSLNDVSSLKNKNFNEVWGLVII